MKDAQMKLIESKLKAKEVKEKKAKPRGRMRDFGLKYLARRTHPYVFSTISFDDNIHSVENGNKSQFQYHITPGVRMNFFGRGSSLTWDTYVDNVYYQHRPSGSAQDTNNDTEEAASGNYQDITSGVLINYGLGRSTLSIYDSLFTNRITAREMGMDTDGVEYYWKNTFNAMLGRHFNRIGFEVGYDNIQYDYEDKVNLSNRFEETYSFTQYLRIATKTRLLLEYAYNRVKYTHKPIPSGDSRFHSYNLGITGVLSPKITGLMEINCKLADTKESDSSDTGFLGNISYRISQRTDLALILKHIIHEEKIKANYALDNTFSLTGNHRFAFNPKFNFSLFCGVDYVDYPKRIGFKERKDGYVFGFGLSYVFNQWLDLSLDYAYKETFSNVSDDFKNNLVTFETQARF
jgi:hypothetical protein